MKFYTIIRVQFTVSHSKSQLLSKIVQFDMPGIYCVFQRSPDALKEIREIDFPRQFHV